MLLVLAALPARADLPDTLDRVRPSIVAIGTIKDLKGARNASIPVNYTGTGFVVGNGLQVITNHHVLPQQLDEQAKEQLVVFSGRGSSAQGHPARVLRSDLEHDLALLEITGPALPALTLAGDTMVREGSDVAFTGFPIGIVLGLYPATHRGIVAAVTPVVTPALTSRALTAEHIRRIRSPFDVYQLDAIAYPGNSGSPLYDVKSGHVIGVINSVLVKRTKESILKDPSAISYAIPVRHVRALLGAGG